MANSLGYACVKPDMDNKEQLLLGNAAAFEKIIRSHNQRLFRIARGILRDNFEAEDIVQEAYIKAFNNLENLDISDDFGGWLAKVTSNLAISRLRQKNRNIKLVEELVDHSVIHQFASASTGGLDAMSPEQQTAMGEVRILLEREIDELPDGFREVFVLRLVEGMSVAKTAEILELPSQTVKSRLHRSKAKIQNSIKSQLTVASLEVFPFAGEHCDRITTRVLAELEGMGVIHTA